MSRSHTSDFQVNGACAFILNGPKVDIIPLYRGAGRGEEFYFQRGFAAQGNNPDLLAHVDNGAKTSTFIPTSKSKAVATVFGGRNSLGKKIFVYEINPQSNGIDIFKTFSDALKANVIDESIASHIRLEHEVAVPERIFPQDIKGVRIYDANPINGEIVPGSETYAHNPNYVPPPLPSAVQNLQKGIKIIGRTGMAIGAAVDATSLCFAFCEGLETDEYQRFFNEGARILGGWKGAFTVGTACAAKGALWFAPLGPCASLVGSTVFGLAGSIAGYLAGGEIAQYVETLIHQAIKEGDFLEIIISSAIIPNVHAAELMIEAPQRRIQHAKKSAPSEEDADFLEMLEAERIFASYSSVRPVSRIANTPAPAFATHAPAVLTPRFFAHVPSSIDLPRNPDRTQATTPLRSLSMYAASTNGVSRSGITESSSGNSAASARFASGVSEANQSGTASGGTRRSLHIEITRGVVRSDAEVQEQLKRVNESYIRVNDFLSIRR